MMQDGTSTQIWVDVIDKRTALTPDLIATYLAGKTSKTISSLT